MSLATIPEIRVETAGDEATYWLPVRPLGKIRWFGLLLVGFSVLWISQVGRMLLPMVHQFSDGKQHGFVYIMATFLFGFRTTSVAFRRVFQADDFWAMSGKVA